MISIDKAKNFKIQVSSNIPEFFSWKDSELIFNSFLYYPESDVMSGHLYDVVKEGVKIGYLISNPENSKVLEFSAIESPYGKYLDEYISQKFSIERPLKLKLLYSPGVYSIEVQVNNKNEIYQFTSDSEVSIKIDLVKFEVNKIVLPSSVGYKLISGGYDLPYYISCIPTAIGNVIAYWDTSGYTNLIKGTMNGMIDEINDLMLDTYGSNTSNGAIPITVNWYCHTSTRYPSFFNTYNLWYPSFEQYKSEIDASRPCLVGYGSSGPYSGAHMTAGFGYYYEPNIPSEKYAIVRDAWTDTPANCYRLWNSSYNDFISRIVP